VSHTVKIGRAMVNNFPLRYLYAEAPQGSVAPPAAVVSALAETGVFYQVWAVAGNLAERKLVDLRQRGRPGYSYSGSLKPGVGVGRLVHHGARKAYAGIRAGLSRIYGLTRNADDDFYGDFGFSSGTITNNNLPITAAGAAAAARTGFSGRGGAHIAVRNRQCSGRYDAGTTATRADLSGREHQTQAGNPQTHVFRYSRLRGKTIGRSQES